MLTQYMFAFVFPDTGSPTVVYVDTDRPDGVNAFHYAKEAWTKLQSEQPRTQRVPFEAVDVYIRSADGLYIQMLE